MSDREPPAQEIGRALFGPVPDDTAAVPEPVTTPEPETTTTETATPTPTTIAGRAVADIEAREAEREKREQENRPLGRSTGRASRSQPAEVAGRGHRRSAHLA